MADLDIRLKKFVQILPSLPKYDADGKPIPGVFTDKKTLWAWFFDRENYWTITETTAQLNALEKKIIDNLDWKETVATFADIATTYPIPQEGWTVSVADTNTIYRYDAASTTWIKIFESSTELASPYRNGLMSSVDFIKLSEIEHRANLYIHPSTHPATIITTDTNNRFVTDALINKWNALVTFPGFAGIGGEYGTSPSSARSDHNHTVLDRVTKINFKAADTDTAWIGVTNPSGEISYMDFYLGDNVVDNQDAWRWIEIQSGVGSEIVYMQLSGSGLYFKGTKVSLEGHKHAMSDITGLSLDWGAITGKPSSFNPSAHRHTMGEIDGLSLDWGAITGKPSTFSPSAHRHATAEIDGGYDWGAIYNKPETATRWPNWSEVISKPDSFTPSAHTHSEYVPISGGTYTGYVDFLGGAGNTGSDMRYKSIVSTNIGNVIPLLKRLKIFDYIWNKKDEQKRVTFGVDADQLISFGGSFKKLVHTREDEEKTKWVEYDRLGLIAIKGLQELCIQQEEDNNKLRKVLSVIAEKLNISLKDFGL